MDGKSRRDIREIMRDEMVMRKKISEILESGSKTIPELSEELEYPSYEIQLWLMAMWRYGRIVPSAKADKEGYFHYSLAPENVQGEA